MAFTLDYFPEEQLVLIRVTGNVSLEENREIGLRIGATLDQAKTNADILFDLRAIGRFPTSISQLRQTSAVIRSPKLGWMILVTGDTLLKFVATVLIQLQTGAPRIRVFDTLERAMEFLQDTQPISRTRADWLADLRKSLN